MPQERIQQPSLGGTGPSSVLCPRCLRLKLSSQRWGILSLLCDILGMTQSRRGVCSSGSSTVRPQRTALPLPAGDKTARVVPRSPQRQKKWARVLSRKPRLGARALKLESFESMSAEVSSSQSLFRGSLPLLRPLQLSFLTAKLHEAGFSSSTATRATYPSRLNARQL